MSEPSNDLKSFYSSAAQRGMSGYWEFPEMNITWAFEAGLPDPPPLPPHDPPPPPQKTGRAQPACAPPARPPPRNPPAGPPLRDPRPGRLIGRARRYNFLILEDNVYGALRYDGDPIPSLLSLDDTGLVFRVDSFSKTVAPALRLGWVTGHPDVI